MSFRLVEAYLQRLAKFYQIFPVFPIENAICMGALRRIARWADKSPLKHASLLVQSSFAKRYLMKAILGFASAVAVVILR
jgi:hypothetical protein